jgi:DNA modification methylase
MYAMHPDIRSKYFALCNGRDIALFRNDVDRTLLLRFPLTDIDLHWEELNRYISPKNFQDGKKIQYEKPKGEMVVEFNEAQYCRKKIIGELPVRKQAARRHFGCNAYFTRQTWNVVAEYIKNYTRRGDIVLDSFGGSGITAVEALMNERKAIHIDLNPLSIFLVDSLVAPVGIAALKDAFSAVCKEYEKKEPQTDDEVKRALQKYKQPKDLPLPKNSDVQSVHQLFSNRQRAQLSLLKYLINKQKDKNIKKSLLLAFYNTLTVCNLTFHDTPHGGGNHFGFYYRYRIAREPANRDTLKIFRRKFRHVLAGKEEMNIFNYAERIDDIKIVKGTATDLSFIETDSVDYIYTDPPYGAKIQYLDLSVMWNAWLDLNVSDDDYKLEAIEDGKLDKSKNEYKQLIAASIKEMFRVLKFDRWMSFVFAHKDPEFWDLIINTAEQCGFEYVGAVSQKNGQTSFKKRQRPFTVLSGQLIINFRKVRNPKTLMKANLGMDITAIIINSIESIIAKNQGATLEQINDELIVRGLELGFLDILAKEYSDLKPLLMQEFDYDSQRDVFNVKKRGFRSHVDIHLRISYFLTSFLTRCECQGKVAHFDDIIREVMPSLKNGATPEDQTILSVLEDIAVRVGEDGWRLKGKEQDLFDVTY